MQIKVTLVGPDANVADSERKNIVVETHRKRNDTFNVLKTDTVLEAAETIFTVLPGDKLVIITQEEKDEIVFDAAQNAGVRRSQQANDAGRADRPGEKPDHGPGEKMRPTAPNPPPSVLPPNGGRMSPNVSPQPRGGIQGAQSKVNTTQPPQPKVETVQAPATPPANTIDTPPTGAPTPKPHE